MVKLFFIYLLFINFISFISMLIDKSRAVHKEWRIPEKTLLSFSILGGSIGMLLGMYSFRHKTKHKKFTLGVPFILLLHIFILIYFLKILN